MTDTKERPFKCHECPKAFRRKAEVKRHMMTHSEKKPFQCGKCGKSYKVRISLKKHLMTHMPEGAVRGSGQTERHGPMRVHRYDHIMRGWVGDIDVTDRGGRTRVINVFLPLDEHDNSRHEGQGNEGIHGMMTSTRKTDYSTANNVSVDHQTTFPTQFWPPVHGYQAMEKASSVFVVSPVYPEHPYASNAFSQCHMGLQNGLN